MCRTRILARAPELSGTSVRVMADAIFEERRLAEVYDPLDPDRSDLDAYMAIVNEFNARSVLDIGCGTGTFACLLARHGIEVTGVDPAGASLDVARAKPGADTVRWLRCDAATLPPMQVDLAVMTGNVAQVFLTDDDWTSTLRGGYAALRPGGHLVFETRDPAKKAWLEWNRRDSQARTDIPGVGGVETWVEVTDVSGDLVSFRWTITFLRDGAVFTSDSTLRFRSRVEVEDSLAATGFMLVDVRDAPDRPGGELVLIARRRAQSCTSTYVTRFPSPTGPGVPAGPSVFRADSVPRHRLRRALSEPAGKRWEACPANADGLPGTPPHCWPSRQR
jgi:SAM-dependent methyltransferase